MAGPVLCQLCEQRPAVLCLEGRCLCEVCLTLTEAIGAPNCYVPCGDARGLLQMISSTFDVPAPHTGPKRRKKRRKTR